MHSPPNKSCASFSPFRKDNYWHPVCVWTAMFSAELSPGTDLRQPERQQQAKVQFVRPSGALPVNNNSRAHVFRPSRGGHLYLDC